tara:strand:- start:844 stop:1467 length:624 start_codon:yes stop_codon:yes gene_type:complete
MPYYQELKLLFIHVPKTGGSTMENYLKKKSVQTLFFGRPYNSILPIKNVSLQHQTFKTIKENQKLLKVNFDHPEFKVISIVRNPYDRVISDMFFLSKISSKSTPEVVFEKMKIYVNSHCDNHNLPQYKFLTLDDKTLVPEIKLFRTETLSEDAEKYGLKNFNGNRFKKGKVPMNNYSSFLNNDSIKLINEVYKKDFELFNYEMKLTE